MSARTTTVDAFRTFLLVAQLDERGLRARIREARKAARLTQQELADLLEVHKRTVENYERVRIPDFKTLVRIAAILEREVEWFLYGDAEQPDRGPGQEELSEKLQTIEAELADQRRLLVALQTSLDALIAATAPASPASRPRARQGGRAQN